MAISRRPLCIRHGQMTAERHQYVLYVVVLCCCSASRPYNSSCFVASYRRQTNAIRTQRVVTKQSPGEYRHMYFQASLNPSIFSQQAVVFLSLVTVLLSSSNIATKHCSAPSKHLFGRILLLECRSVCPSVTLVIHA